MEFEVYPTKQFLFNGALGISSQLKPVNCKTSQGQWIREPNFQGITVGGYKTMQKCNELDPENRSLLDAITNKVCEQPNLDVTIPSSYEEAKKSAEWPLWRDACNRELAVLAKVNAYSVEHGDSSYVSTRLDWAFSIEEDGRYRARMVAKQTLDIDGTLHEVTNRPVPQFSLIRFFLSVAAKKHLSVSHLKFNAAYFNAQFDNSDGDYALPPPGMMMGGKSVEGSILKVHHYIEGYARAFLERDYSITKALRTHGFFPVHGDIMMFTRGTKQNLVLILVSDEDLLIATSNEEKANVLKEKLVSLYEMRDLGALRKIKGINVSFSSRFVMLSLEDYIGSLLRDYDMEDCVPSRIPCQDIDVNVNGTEKSCDLEQFRSLLGKLLYASTTVRCDIAHIIYDLLGALSKPKQKHLETATCVLRYLKGTKTKGIHIHKDYGSSDLSHYLKANYVPRALESFLGLTTLFCGAPLYWRMYYGCNGRNSLYAFTPNNIGDEATRFSEMLRSMGFNSESKFYSDDINAFHNWKKVSVRVQPQNARKRSWEEEEEETHNLDVCIVPSGPADLLAKKLPHGLHEPRCIDFNLW